MSAIMHSIWDAVLSRALVHYRAVEDVHFGGGGGLQPWFAVSRADNRESRLIRGGAKS